MLESAVERKLTRGITRAGGVAWKFTSPGRVGVPDRLVIMPGGQIVFVELKQDKGRLSPIQRSVIERIRSLGARVEVLYGEHDVEEFLWSLNHTDTKITP